MNFVPPRDLSEIFAHLQRADFRKKFRLNAKDADYLRKKARPVTRGNKSGLRPSIFLESQIDIATQA